MADGAQASLEGMTAGVMIGPLFEDVEAIYPYFRLQEAGASVLVVGVSAGETVTGKHGLRMDTRRAAGHLAADDLDILVLPGGHGPDKLRVDPGVLGLLRRMQEQYKPITFN